MASARVDYGIDLGTTNSVIARMQRGTPVVVKSKDVHQNDTTPSAVAIKARRNKTEILVGAAGRQEWELDRKRTLHSGSSQHNAFVEFKRTMGTDHRDVPDIDPKRSFSSEQLSAEVLKKLRSYVIDEGIRAAVVTIPAAFTVPQQQATLRATELAGLRQCSLLQEPVAAAMAYGLSRDHGTEKWLVFDFGGGTFDSALVLVDDGEVTVKDTEGDNHLGGKDLDYAVVDEIFLDEVEREFEVRGLGARIPDSKQRLRDVLKKYAEDANIALSSQDSHEVYTELDTPIRLPGGQEIELDFEITRDRLRPVVTPIFQRAIDKAKVLLQRHGLSGSDLDELILVGGPTYSPILREMLGEQIRRPNTSVDPMTIVAQGAALFGSTVSLERGAFPESHSGSLLGLGVGWGATSISPVEFVSVKFGNSSDFRCLGALEIELVANNSAVGWRTGKQRLTGQAALFELRLEENKPNVFDLIVTTERGDQVATNPSEITIIHGTKVTGSPLPNNLGVEVWSEADGNRVFAPLRGAEKSKRLPVTGISTGLSTHAQIRPGVSSDRLLIRIYEGGADAPGVPVTQCKHVMALELTGDQVTRVIPAGTALELTLITEASSSVPKVVRVLFPAFDDEEYKLKIPSIGQPSQTEWIDDEVVEAQKRIDSIRTLGHGDSTMLDEVAISIEHAVEQIARAGSDTDAKNKAVSLLKEKLRGLHKLVRASEWTVAEAKLDEAWADLNKANREEGYDESRREMREAKQRLDQVKNARDPRLARELMTNFEHSLFMLKRCEWSKSIVAWARQQFTSIRWKNAGQARRAVESGVRALVADEPCSELLQHAREILALVVQDSPDDSRPPVPHLDGLTR